MILDTSFLIDLMDGHQAAIDEGGRLDAMQLTQRVSILSLYELYVGVGYKQEPDDEAMKIQQVLQSRAIEQLTPEMARTAGRMEGELQRKGVTVNAVDIIIGATARHYNEKVLTANPVDFERLPDVIVRTYR
jgi:predicted nucleic acid-binding protein